MERPKKNPQRVRTRYTKEFKLEAVRLLQLGQKPATELALELGIRRNQLYKWAEELSRKDGDEALAFNGPRGRPPADQLSEIERLKRELKKVSEERDILKKAAAERKLGVRSCLLPFHLPRSLTFRSWSGRGAIP